MPLAAAVQEDSPKELFGMFLSCSSSRSGRVAGTYGIDRIADLSPERKRRFFLRGTGPNEGLVRVKPHLRKLVEFRQLNLLAPDYGLRQRFVAVFCRNVMIYFDKPTQYDVLRKVVPLLAPGGRFYAGHSESFAHALDLVQPCGRTIYRAAQESR
ncbi:TPA: hypothetical protein NHL10_006550 [Pseudomonas aeruginosa]|jgi:chemotaxis protein methyltransferase CheR|nr:hypothetical protein [Pseudomonas aeruginosa]